MSQYKVLDNFIMAYLNEDAIEITGEHELPGMINYYFNDVGKDVYLLLRDEIDDFIASNDDVDTAFTEAYANEWNVGPGKAFLLEVKALAEKRWEDVQTPIKEECEWIHPIQTGASFQPYNAFSDQFFITSSAIFPQDVIGKWHTQKLSSAKSSRSQPKQEVSEFFDSLKNLVSNDSLTAEQSMILVNILLTKKSRENSGLRNEGGDPFGKVGVMSILHFEDKDS
ncbi:contact-dependent growth inhibition system immunity protein [Enterobacter hormaechei]|nr:contact-dependent growth inhibition system immunity protein [Enterobacter hormaechei]